jgi:hypothetical protein
VQTVYRARENFGAGSFSRTSRTGKQVSVTYSVVFNLVCKRPDYVILSDDFIKRIGTEPSV